MKEPRSQAFMMPGKLQLTGRVRGVLRSLVPAGLNISRPHDDFAPLEMDGLVARCLRDWPDDPAFFSQYQELIARSPFATLFNSPVWQSAVVNEFIPAGQFRLITVERDRRLLALLPLGLNTAAMLETPGRWLTDYLDPLVDPGAAEPAWEMILRLLGSLWDWSLGGLALHHIREDNPLRTLLPALAPKLGFDYCEEAVSCAPFIPLPKTWDEYLASIDRHERKEIKRKIRKATDEAGMRWMTLKTPEEFAPALERALGALRQAESEKADFSEEVLVGFLRQVAPRLNRSGDFYVQELTLNDQPAAWLMCLRSPSGPMIYNTCYDFSQRQWSPGIVSFCMAMQQAIAEGASVFNLLRGAEEYKKRLGARDLALFKVQLLPA